MYKQYSYSVRTSLYYIRTVRTILRVNKKIKKKKSAYWYWRITIIYVAYLKAAHAESIFILYYY